MESAPSLNSSSYDNLFSVQTHTIVGIYLFVIGFVGTLTNSLVLTTFYRYRNLVSPTALLLINLTISDMGILGILFPFSSSSCFARRWLYGDDGCQAYAFIGFLAGTAHIGTLTLLALDRYKISSQKSKKFRDKHNYYKWIYAVWTYALFWATMPLIGWGRYGLDNNISACTIDWKHNDISYKSFIIFYFIFCFSIPFCVIAYCYYALIVKVRNGSIRIRNAGINGESIWVKEKTVTIMSVIIVVVFVISWSPYAILCLWTVFGDPETVPLWFRLISPLFAKTSTLFNPIIYYLTNSRLRGAFLSAVCCRDISYPINNSQSRVTHSLDIDQAPSSLT